MNRTRCLYLVVALLLVAGLAACSTSAVGSTTNGKPAVVAAEYKRLDPKDASAFDRQRSRFERQGLGEYHHLISEIHAKYAGTPVGASESIFAPMAQALGLHLVTPPSFLRAISEGTEPTAA